MGRSCELHRLAYGQPHDPNNNFEQTPNGRLSIATRRRPHHGDQVEHLFLCEVCKMMMMLVLSSCKCICMNSPSTLTLLSTVNIAKSSQTEAVSSRRINISINRDVRLTRWNLKCLAHLCVEFKVRNRAPILGSWLSRETLLLIVHISRR